MILITSHNLYLYWTKILKLASLIGSNLGGGPSLPLSRSTTRISILCSPRDKSCKNTKYPVARALYVPGLIFPQMSIGFSGIVKLKKSVFTNDPSRSTFLPSMVTFMLLRGVRILSAHSTISVSVMGPAVPLSQKVVVIGSRMALLSGTLQL